MIHFFFQFHSFFGLELSSLSSTKYQLQSSSNYGEMELQPECISTVINVVGFKLKTKLYAMDCM
jgi:hypothetical protein